jgi:pimeloyl-ACP methyl ester carboxylesterase
MAVEMPRLGRSNGPARRLSSRAGLLSIAAVTASAAVALFVHARARRAECENPPLGRFLEIGGTRLHFVDQGSGEPAVVLLHGNGAMVQDFAISGVLGLAAERHRVLAFDRPGYGYSTRPRTRLWTPAAQAELLREALRRLGVERPIIVGHSWGTLVALALASRYPAEIRGLVLLSGYYFPTPRLDVTLVSLPALPVLGDLLRYTIAPLLGRLLLPRILRQLFAPGLVPPRFAAGFPFGLSLRPSQIRASAAEAALMIPATIALRRRYRALRIPAVIMAGTGDRLVDIARQSARLPHALPHAEFRPVPGAGHMVHHSAPNGVLAAIDAVARS